jgi:integrase
MASGSFDEVAKDYPDGTRAVSGFDLEIRRGVHGPRRTIGERQDNRSPNGRRPRGDLRRRGPYHLRHTFATEALAAGVSIFELSRLIGTSVAMIDRHYGHLARDSEDAIRARLDARSRRSDVFLARGAGEQQD